jgi:hypothetical protein
MAFTPTAEWVCYPCIAYADSTTTPASDRAVAKQFTGSEWTVVGDEGFSPGSAFELSMDIDSKGVVYVAFRDPTSSEYATVMAFR